MESVFICLIIGIFGLGIFHLFLDFCDSREDLESYIDFYVLMAFIAMMIVWFIVGSVVLVKADTVYDGSEFDWVYKQGDADSLGFSGGLFVDNKRLLKGARSNIRIDLGSKGSMVIFKNDVASYDGNIVSYYYVAYSGSKIYVLNPRDRRAGKPYLFVKRYNDFLPVEHRGFKGFNDVTESRDLVDDNRVYTNPFFSKYGMTVTGSGGNARFRVGKNGDGSWKTATAEGPMPRPSSWNFGNGDILWGNGIDIKDSFWYVPSRVEDTYNVGYVEKVGDELREMTPDDVSSSSDFSDELARIRASSGAFGSTKEEYEKGKEERKKIAQKKKEEEEKMGFWGKLFKPIGEFFKKFWEIFIYDDKAVKQSFKTALSYMDKKLSASNPVSKGGRGIGSGAERAGNFLFDHLYIADEGYTELGQKGLNYGTTLNTFYVNKSAWRQMVKLFLEAMYTMAFFLYIWKKKEKIAK